MKSWLNTMEDLCGQREKYSWFEFSSGAIRRFEVSKALFRDGRIEFRFLKINHDSTPFYTSKLYEGLQKEKKIEYVENPISPQFLDKIFSKSSENMEELPDNLMRGEIIWNKASSSSPSTACGSWLSASFRREKFKERKSTISKEEFLEFAKSVWTFPAELARKIGHPAPFPVELPYRLLQLYTYEKEVVLDPFI